MTLNALARIVHEATRALALVSGDPHPPLAWEAAPAWQRETTIAEVLTALAEPDEEQRWKDWRRTRQLAGWRYGPKLDAVARTDPRLGETFENVPVEARRRLTLVSAIVAAAEGWMA